MNVKYTVWQQVATGWWSWSARPPYGDFVYNGFETEEAAMRDAEAHIAKVQIALDTYNNIEKVI